MIQLIRDLLARLFSRTEEPVLQTEVLVSSLETTSKQALLTEKQNTVYELLQSPSCQNDQFGQWYLGALRSLHEKGHDYLSQAAHSIREITDKLPTRAGVPLFESPLPKTREAVIELIRIKGASYESGWEGAAISDELAEALGGLEELKPIFDATPRTLRMKSALELKDPYSPGISPVHRRERDKEFKRVGDFFQKVAHHNSIPSHETFCENLESFEDLLISYLSPVTATQQKEILKIIDAAPTVKEEERLNHLLRHNGANLLLLLERLKEPRWIPFLIRLELFKHPRGGDPTPDGGMAYRSDPALSCIARLANSAQTEVLAILEGLPKSDNPQIPDQIMRCILGINDKSLVPRCLRLLKPILKAVPSGRWIWLEEILGVWWRLGAYDEMASLLRFYLTGLLGSIENSISRRRDWEFEELDRKAIAALSQKRPLEVAKILFYALRDWTRIEKQRLANEPPLFGEAIGKFEDPDCDDPPTYWLEDFTSRSIGNHDLEGTLARRLLQIGSVILKEGKPDCISEFDNLLRSDPWHLFARLRWQLYADYPELSQTLARSDVLSRIPRLGNYSGSHGYEMAQMLDSHCTLHGDSFLSPEDIQAFCAAVRSGPFDYEGKLIDEERYVETFHRKQLHPVRLLLKESDFDYYEKLMKDVPTIRLEQFKPFSSGGGGTKTIVNVAPKQADSMDTMAEPDLWKFLNEWAPNSIRPDSEKWWVEESIGALGLKFAELLEIHRDRFLASTEWWKNLFRPSIIFKPLDRATARISNDAKDNQEESDVPSENEWRNWFGLAAWIAESRTSPKDCGNNDSAIDSNDADWNWPSIIVVRFLSAALHSKAAFPNDLRPEVGRILAKLVVDPDPRLADKDKPMLDDWQTTAINSVRGTAIEGLLQLALFNKQTTGNPDPDDWIYNILASRLRLAGESPAVFAILGSRLPLALYLFHKHFEAEPELLLPTDHPEHRHAFLLSHVRYSNPFNGVVETLPNFPDAAIDCLAELIANENPERQTRGDFGGLLGTHLGFHYWNGAYADQATAEAVMDRYFATAKPEQRGKFVRNIARMFKDSPLTKEFEPLHELVRALWDRRFEFISQNLAAGDLVAADVHSELAAVIDWLGCECFPFEWRCDRVLQAIQLIENAPRSPFVIETLDYLSAKPEKLSACIKILDTLASKDVDELRWSYQDRHLKPLLLRGLNSSEATTQKVAKQIQENLLRQGMSEYLDLTAEVESQAQSSEL
jgi:hypothetical protein